MRTIAAVLLLCASVLGQLTVYPPGEMVSDPSQFMVPTPTVLPSFTSQDWPDMERAPFPSASSPLFTWPIMEWDVLNDALKFDLYWDQFKVSSIGIPATNTNPFAPDLFLFHPNHGVTHLFVLVDFGNPYAIAPMAYIGGVPLGPFLGVTSAIAELRIGNAPYDPFCSHNWRPVTGFPVCTGGVWGDVFHTVQVNGYPPGFVHWASTISMSVQFLAFVPNGIGDYAMFLTQPKAL